MLPRSFHKFPFRFELVDVVPSKPPNLRTDLEGSQLSPFSQMAHHSQGKAEPLRNMMNEERPGTTKRRMFDKQTF
jgi:hypothetical protein